MPTYEYRCNGCGHDFEDFHGINDDPITLCPVCNEEKVERLISGGAGLIFKGTGFYITDYKKSNASPVNTNGNGNGNGNGHGNSNGNGKREAEATAKSESKSESKTESKPESKTKERTEK